MATGEVLYSALRNKYEGLAREIITKIGIGPPSLTHPPLKQDATGQYSKEFMVFNKAIWDTGASNTVITEPVVNKIIEKHDLQPTGIISVNSVGDIHQAETYLVDVMIPPNVHIRNLKVTCDKLAGADVLIGMDIIQRGDFCLSNAKGKTTFSFSIPPHNKVTDFYLRTLEENAKTKKRNKRRKR